jgi:hypothetical protein
MPELAPPQFECINEQENSIDLIYRSHRIGMVPMLMGLIKGLGKRFGKEVVIQQIENNTSESSAVIFHLIWS